MMYKVSGLKEESKCKSFFMRNSLNLVATSFLIRSSTCSITAEGGLSSRGAAPFLQIVDRTDKLCV